uniref:Uncharacterized protein n=1 Tax=Ditylenchus dipsaci TaxID=166011 RepID=A0A915E6L0_9BILA
MGSRLHSWINQPVQDLQLGSGIFPSRKYQQQQSVSFAFSADQLGNFSSPPPSLITKFMPQPALNKFYASNVLLDKTSFASLLSRPIKTATFQKTAELPTLVSPSIELLPNEQLIWDVVFSKVKWAVENKQAAPELLEELKFIKNLSEKIRTSPNSDISFSSCRHALNKKVSADSELSFAEKIVKVVDDFDSLSVSSSGSVKSASLQSIVSTGSSKQVENGCSLCFGDYKNYCILNNLLGFSSSVLIIGLSMSSVMEQVMWSVPSFRKRSGTRID